MGLGSYGLVRFGVCLSVCLSFAALGEKAYLPTYLPIYYWRWFHM